jgi:hypothetical protein
MKDKILFWLDMEWIRFGIAKFLQESYDCDLYAIMDTDKVATNFYKRQDIVKFQKVWYYRDYILKNNKKVDIEYLQKFEEKYKINLWQAAYSERFFYKYNQYHKFQYDEILSILEKECKFFESVLDEINPDFLVIKLTDTHQSNIFHQICKSKGIRILMMIPTRFAYRFAISDEDDKIDEFNPDEINNIEEKTLEELRNYSKKYHALQQTNKFKSNLKISYWKRIEKFFNYVIKMNDSDFKNYFINYGRTPFKAMTKFLFLQQYLRKSFIDKNLVKMIDKNTPFIYYPLQAEPERTLLLSAPFYTDQIELITRIAKAMPVGFKLYVKEHASMSLVGWRDISYYKKILELPNVVLIHPSVNSDELLKNSSLVVTIRGTTGIEATFYEKPTITLIDVNYSALPSVYKIKNIEELPQKIQNMLGKTTSASILNKYVNYVEKKTFELDVLSLYTDLHNYFFKEFNIAGEHISVSKMDKFLENHKSQFELLALEHIKKIKYYKEVNATSNN